MTSACEHVLTTPELLESILIQLYHVAPPHELLRAQRISHRFHTTITSSPRIQQLLFLRSEPTSGLNPWRTNTLLRDHFLPWFVGPPSAPWSGPNYEALRMLDWTSSSCKAEAFLRPEASWRKMLFVQPPPKQLSVFRFGHGKYSDIVEEAKVSLADSAPDGVTMGVIYDITESFLRGEPRSTFGISVTNTETGLPQITLHLVSDVECVSSQRDIGLVSQGAKSLGEVSALEWRTASWYPGWTRDVSINWGTDFSVEKGGIEPWAWEEWKRKRAPISDLVSDVR